LQFDPLCFPGASFLLNSVLNLATRLVFPDFCWSPSA